MGDIISVCGVGLFSVFVICIVRDIRRDIVLPLILAMCVVVFCLTIPKLSSVISFAKECSDYLDGGYASYILRALGITYITYISSEICKSAGEAAIAGYVETAGRVEIIILCLPLFREFLSAVLL
ncbi:MAG: hypothetical protein E7672_05675 [Ruminococcaceae bacterium]|nr:hypothetical protein [Oscillospiraceae bacterium]